MLDFFRFIQTFAKSKENIHSFECETVGKKSSLLCKHALHFTSLCLRFPICAGVFPHREQFFLLYSSLFSFFHSFINMLQQMAHFSTHLLLIFDKNSNKIMLNIFWGFSAVVPLLRPECCLQYENVFVFSYFLLPKTKKRRRN